MRHLLTILLIFSSLFSISNDCAGAEPPITVLSPNGGEFINASMYIITWKTSGDVGTLFKIELYKGDSYNSTIVDATPNEWENGEFDSYTAAFPLDQETGTDYKIKISSVTNPSYYDFSDSYFTISIGGQSSKRISGLSGNLAFGNVQVGQTATRTLTISNSGNSALAVSSISYPSGFSGAWSGNIPAGGSVDVTVTFAPTSATNYDGTITVNSNATSGTNTIAVSGTGTSTPTRIIGLSGNLAFGDVQVGQTAIRTLTISNSGNSTLAVNNIIYPSGFSGAYSGNISAGGSANVTVTFAPTSVTSYGGTITVNSDKTSGTNTITAAGNGTSAPTRIISLSGNMTFGDVQVGQTATRLLTISNSGNSILSVTSINYPSGFSGAYSGNISAGNSVNVTVTFAPTLATSYGGAITVNSNATNGTNTLSCSGTGITVSKVATPSISPNGGTFTTPQQITLFCSTSGATIRYTTNGADPTSSSTLYSSPFTISTSCIIRAKAFKSGYTNSDIASGSFIVSIPQSGYIFGWGENYVGSATPPAGNNFIAIATGINHSLVLKSNGSIIAWGGNSNGECNAPAGNDFIAIAAGGYHSLALKSDGSIIGWGRNDYNQAASPVGNNFIAIAAGAVHSLALKSDGSIIGWGNNQDQWGNWAGQATPPLESNFIAIAAGGWHSLALKTDGSIVGWGYNYNGIATPPAGNNFIAIADGVYHSLALKSDGSIVAWGNNHDGECNVPSGNDFFTISAGYNYSLALKSDGSILGWGYNSYGEATPPSGNSFTAISAGRYKSFAITSSCILPDAPWGVHATNGTYMDHIQITWYSISHTGVDVYEIYKNTSNNLNTALKISGDETSLYYDDYDVTSGHTYFYWITAKNSCGTSNFSSATSGYVSVSPPQTGGLQVTIIPEEAVFDGARWNVDGGGWWISSGDSVSDLTVGLHTVYYSEIPGWITPASEQITITNGQTTYITSPAYVQILNNLPIKKCAMIAGKGINEDKDSIIISGTIDITSAYFIGICEVDVNIGSVYSEAIPTSMFVSKKGKFTYTHKIPKGSAGAITSFVIDTNKHTFTLKAQKVDLTGLYCPFNVEFEICNDLWGCTLDENIVNGKNFIPVQLMTGFEDYLQVQSVKVKKGKKPSTDFLSAKGGIAFKDMPSSMSDVALMLDGQPFTIPAGSFKPSGKSGLKYVCKNAVVSGGGIASATFDFGKYAFVISIKNTTINSQTGEVVLNLTMGSFNEQVNFDLDTGQTIY